MAVFPNENGTPMLYPPHMNRRSALAESSSPTVCWIETLTDTAAPSLYLKALIEHNPIAVVVLDQRHRFRMSNPAFEALFQYRSEDLIACDLDALIAAPDRLQEAALFSRDVLAGRKVHALTQRRRKDGMVVDVELYGIPLIVDGEVEGVYGLYQDVTERNRAQNEVREIAGRLDRTRLDERRRFARDLHDSTSQEITILRWNLNRLLRLVDDTNPAAQKLIQETQEVALQCAAKIRTTAYLLHPPVLDEAGLEIAIRWLAEGFAQRSGLTVETHIAPGIRRSPEQIEVALFLLVQEALANVLRHSPASVVRIELTSTDGRRLRLSFTNTPAAGAPTHNSAPPHEGLGIQSMRERIEELNGNFHISSGADGTHIVAEIPLPEQRP